MTTEGHLKDGLIFRASYAGNMRININMSGSVYLCCLLLVFIQCVNSSVHSDIDINQPNVCGTTKDIRHNEKVNLLSKGSVANNTCEIVLQKAGKLPDVCRFHYLCVNVSVMDRENCSAITTLVGMSMDKANITREIKCDSAFINPWCTASETLVVRVEERNKNSAGYNIKIIAHSTCKKKAIVTEFIKDPVKIEDGEAAVNHIRLMGIIVGVSLASVFLVIFLITYMYYKLKNPDNRKKAEEKAQPRAQYTRKPAM